MRRTILITVAALALTTLLNPPEAALAGGQPAETAVEVSIVPGGDPAAPNLEVTERDLDEGGRTLDSRRFTTRSRKVRPLTAPGEMGCLYDRNREGFVVHSPQEIFDPDWKNEYVHYQFHPYQQRNARVVRNVRTQQWLICATGGAEGENGSRITRSGPAITFRDEDRTSKLGHSWKEGSTPASHSVNLAFQVGIAPVKVTGSFTQGLAKEHIKGAELKPTGDNQYGRNQAAAWWEFGCLDPTFCGSHRGSSEWQGSVVEALYEFPDTQSVSVDDFYFSAFWVHHCGTQSGICR